MKVSANHTVTFEGIGFNAAAVASIPKEDWVKAEMSRYWPTTPADERKAKLETVHDSCTKACTDEGIELTPAKIKAPKAKREQEKQVAPPPRKTTKEKEQLNP